MAKKGFRLPKRTAVLDFSGTDFEGAEVKCRLDVPMGMLMEFQILVASMDDTTPQQMRDAFVRFGDAILESWNIEDDEGGAVPANGEGMLQATQQFAMGVLEVWAMAVGQPPAPLDSKSSNGTLPVSISEMMDDPEVLSLGDLSRPNL